ncbi:MAG: zinc ribbon domain-containing protein [Verrucomicrobiota bacterium]|nr:zinc ribbon domain-containing protein [Verrucomicrobiota bacterium]
MPTYEYQCTACGHEFEIVQSMKDATLQQCPACKKKKLKRLIGKGAGIIFKGTGFYQTDYKNVADKPEAKPKVAKDSEAKSGTDAKPAEKSATDAKSASADSPSTSSTAPAAPAAPAASSPAAKPLDSKR